jgi:hypothetical protein
MNIRRSPLHSIVVRAHIFLFSEVIEWIIGYIVLRKSTIVDSRGECIGSFLAVHLEKYYRFPKHELQLVTPFINEFYDKNDSVNILANLKKEEKNY